MRLLTVIGARPQFIKAAPVSAALKNSVEECIVHTGQHHDPELSDVLVAELGLRAPDLRLGIHGGSHAEMVGRMLLALDPILVDRRPDAVLVYGDTNSTLAGALAADQRNIPVLHVEAGLRSFDRRMPEERNRVLTDHLSAHCFCPSESAADQLRLERISAGVHVIGDVMQDALLATKARAELHGSALEKFSVKRGAYVLATIHRAENTDDPVRLRGIIAGLSALDIPVLLPLHPRTRAALVLHGVIAGPNLRMVPPLGHSETVALTAGAKTVVTDSGGLQKEAYWLGVPCVTVRTSTEWTATVTAGWNRLADASVEAIVGQVAAAVPQAERPPVLGAPGAAERMAALLPSLLQ